MIVKCQQCGELIFFKDEQAGQTAPCSVCHSPIILPSKKIIPPPPETANIEPPRHEPEKPPEPEPAPAEDSFDDIPPPSPPNQNDVHQPLPPTFITSPLPPPQMEPEISVPENEMAGLFPRSDVVLEFKSTKAPEESPLKAAPPPMVLCPFCNALLDIPANPNVLRINCPKCAKSLTLLRTPRGTSAAPTTEIRETPFVYVREDVCICGLCKKPVEVSDPNERRMSCPHCKSRISIPQRIVCPDCESRDVVLKIPRKALLLAGLTSEPRGPYYHCNICGRKCAIEFPAVE